MSSLRLPALAALACSLVAACSTESRSTDPSPSEVPFQSGSLSGTTVGRVGAAQTTSSSGATLTGLVGTFTSLSAGGAATGNVATVYFTSGSNGLNPPSVWQIRTDGSGLQKLLPDSVPGFSPSISPSGSRLLFWVEGQPSGTAGAHFETHLMERLPDGTTRRLVTDLDAQAPVSWTPDEQSVIYPLLFQEEPFPAVIRQFRFDSVPPQDLIPREPARSVPLLTVGPVNGHTAVIHEKQDQGLTLLDLTTGLDTAYITPADSEIIRSPDLSRDGSRLLFIVTRPVGNGINRSQLKVADVDHPEAAVALPFRKDSRDNFNDEAHWLQDGSGFVVWASGPPYAQELVLLDAGGNFVRQLTNFPLGVARGFSVGPSTNPSQALIGDDGLLGRTASGIIFGQDSTGGLTSVLGFQSDRPRSVTLKANTGLNSTGPALTYTLTAEQLRTLRFINHPPDGQPVTVVDSTSPPIGGALINFDAENGQVTLVLPFAAGANEVATVTESGRTRSFRGNFLGVWKGRTNLAPQGATEVRLDPATGRMEVTP